jgi:hypothetical protein
MWNARHGGSQQMTYCIAQPDCVDMVRYSAREERRRGLSTTTTSMGDRWTDRHSGHNVDARRAAQVEATAAAGLGCACSSSRLVPARHGCCAEGAK